MQFLFINLADLNKKQMKKNNIHLNEFKISSSFNPLKFFSSNSEIHIKKRIRGINSRKKFNEAVLNEFFKVFRESESFEIQFIDLTDDVLILEFSFVVDNLRKSGEYNSPLVLAGCKKIFDIMNYELHKLNETVSTQAAWNSDYKIYYYIDMKIDSNDLIIPLKFLYRILTLLLPKTCINMEVDRVLKLIETKNYYLNRFTFFKIPHNTVCLLIRDKNNREFFFNALNHKNWYTQEGYNSLDIYLNFLIYFDEIMDALKKRILK